MRRPVRCSARDLRGWWPRASGRPRAGGAYWPLPLLLLLAAAGLAAGCATWNAAAPASRDETAGLPRPRMSSDTVIIETAFVPMPDSAEGAAELWSGVHEAALDPTLRRSLAENGLRAGLIGGSLPSQLRLSTPERSSESMQLLEQAGLSSDVSHAARRIQCRQGRPYELPTREQITGVHPLLLSLDRRVSGAALRNPLPLLVMVVQMQPQGHVRIRLEPKIRHGELRQTVVAQDHAMKISHRREELSPPSLAVEFVLAPGQSAILGPAQPPLGLGKLMLTGQRVDGRSECTALVVRLAQLQSPPVDPDPTN